jgi:uncharacterized protein YcaQ
VSPPVFSPRAVAALFIERQHLERPRALRLSARNLERFAADTGGIQLDSINVLERAHYLTAWSRFGVYDRATLDRLVYRKRVLFEYWAHAACLVATSQFPMWRRAMLDYACRDTGWSFLRKHRATLRKVEDTVRENGPIGSAAFRHERPRTHEAGWWNWTPSAHAFDYLWKKGVLAVHSRVHFHRRLDLIERVLPVALAREPLPPGAFHRWHLCQSLHAMGAATEIDLRLYLTFPRFARAERQRALRALVASGEVTEIAVDWSRARWFALTSELPALESAARRRHVARGTTLLSPFDSFLWHRERTARLFGFDYRIEVYTPGHKRIHGYYSMPIFHDGQLIGRLDAKSHRAEKRLEVRSVHFERWFADGAAPPAGAWHAAAAAVEPALEGLADAIGSLAAFAGAERVTLGRVAPARLKAPLARALREMKSSTPGPVPEEVA